MDVTGVQVNDEEIELAALVALCINTKANEGDRQLNYTRFYNKCRNVYVSILNKTTYNEQLAESIYSDAVLKFFEKVSEGIVVNNIKGFLYQIALHIYLNKIKPEVKYAAKFSFLEEGSSLMLRLSNQEVETGEMNGFEQSITEAMVKLKYLKPEQELILRAFYLDELSYKEVADTYGYSLKEIKSHVQNGKRNLANILKQNANLTKS